MTSSCIHETSWRLIYQTRMYSWRANHHLGALCMSIATRMLFAPQMRLSLTPRVEHLEKYKYCMHTTVKKTEYSNECK